MNDILKKAKNKKNLIQETVEFDGKVTIYPPITIGESVVIRNNCKIGPNVIIGDNVYIDQNTEIKESLIYNETYISKNCKLNNTIISDKCLIHDNVILKGNAQNLVILSSYVEVLKNIQLTAKSTVVAICHHEVVKESIN